ncbi:MAG: M48 family metallopeptidase [Chthoniobacterales bacterium]
MRFLRCVVIRGLVAGVPAGILGGLTGCSTVQETGRMQLMMSDSSDTARESALAFQKLKKEKKISYNSADNAAVKRVGGRLAAVIAPRKNVKWEFVVFEDSEPNAFALPGGKVGVNTGLFNLATSDATLAAVLGHEMTHVTARHGEEGQSQEIVAAVTGVAVDVGLAAMDAPSELGDVFDAGAQVGVLLPYSRLQEYEADKVGMLYMARAGYDPQEAIVFWERMKAWSDKHDDDSSLSFMSTHPLDAARIQKLEKFLPKAMLEYWNATGSRN